MKKYTIQEVFEMVDDERKELEREVMKKIYPATTHEYEAARSYNIIALCVYSIKMQKDKDNAKT